MLVIVIKKFGYLDQKINKIWIFRSKDYRSVIKVNINLNKC